MALLTNYLPVTLTDLVNPLLNNVSCNIINNSNLDSIAISSSLNNVSSNIKLISSNLNSISSTVNDVSIGLSSVSSNLGILIKNSDISLDARGMIANNRTPAVIANNTIILQQAINDAFDTSKAIKDVQGIYSVNSVEYHGAFKLIGQNMLKTGFQAEEAGKPIFKAAIDCQSMIGMTFQDLAMIGLGRDAGLYDSFFEGRKTLVNTLYEGGSTQSAANRQIVFENVSCKHFSGYAYTISDSFNCEWRNTYTLYCGKSPIGSFTNTPTPIFSDGGIGSLGGGLYLKRETWSDVSSTGNLFLGGYWGGNNISIFGGKDVQGQTIGLVFEKTIFEASNYGFYGLRTSNLTFNNPYFEGHLIKGIVASQATINEDYRFPLHKDTTDGFDIYALTLNGGNNKKITADGVVVLDMVHSDIEQGYKTILANSGALKIGDRFWSYSLGSGQSIPEGLISADVGAEYVYYNGAKTIKYKKISGSGNTGWVINDIGVSTSIISNPVNGGVYTATANRETHIFFSSFTNIATYTLKLPLSPIDGDKIYFHTKSGGSISSFIIDGNGASIYGQASSIDSNQVIGFICNGNDPSWYVDSNLSSIALANAQINAVSSSLINITASVNNILTNTTLTLSTLSTSGTLNGVTFLTTWADPITLTASTAMTGFISSEITNQTNTVNIDAWLTGVSSGATARLQRWRNVQGATSVNFGIYNGSYSCTFIGYVTIAGFEYRVSGYTHGGVLNKMYIELIK
jgi:hypothetical protein